MDDPDIPNLSAREAHHTHTYILAQQSETLHRERGFENPSTGTGLLKHTYLQIHTYQLSTQKPSTGRGVLKNPPQAQDFLKHTYQHHNELSAISMCFKTTLPVRAFGRARPKPASLW